MFARPTLALLIVTSAVGLSACGSSSDSGSSSSGGSGGTLTRAQLATKADAICAEAVAASNKVVAPTDFGAAGSDPAKAYQYLSQILPITKKEQSDLAALKPDSEAASDWAAVVKGQTTLTDLLTDIVAKAKAKDPRGLKELAGAAARGKPFIDATTKIGAKGCAAG